MGRDEQALEASPQAGLYLAHVCQLNPSHAITVLDFFQFSAPLFGEQPLAISGMLLFYHPSDSTSHPNQPPHLLIAHISASTLQISIVVSQLPIAVFPMSKTRCTRYGSYYTFRILSNSMPSSLVNDQFPRQAA